MGPKRAKNFKKYHTKKSEKSYCIVQFLIINAPFDTKSVHTDIPLGQFGEVVRKILHNISYLPNIFKETSS